jgi:polysaccharide deacetylase 2 family uncharacterized protein YibQ
MPAGIWKATAGLIVVLLVAVVGLDQWQARHGEVSLLGLSWKARQPRLDAAAAPAQAGTASLPRPPLPTRGGPRVAIIVDDLGGRRDVFELLKEVGRPLAVAVLPELPLSGWIAREAARSGMEVLLDLPMEPYRYPELDPGPGALMMSMSPDELQRVVARHLAGLPLVAGVTPHMGSRMTEDRERMRAVLGVMAARRLFLVDTLTSNLSVAHDEAREMGVRAGRRRVLVDHAGGEAGDRARWDEVARWAERRGEVIVVAHGHPLTARLLKEYIPSWEARGMRLVPVSQLTR